MSTLVKQLYNPPIPFTGTIVGGLVPGKIIEIQGDVPGGARRFHVNLEVNKGPGQNSDIALHFNPRFDDRCVVFNTYRNQWEAEERSCTLPFLTKEKFEIMILVELTEYKVAVNGRHFAEFKHRIPYNQVNTLSIGQDVRVTKIEQRMNTIMPPGQIRPGLIPPVLPRDIQIGVCPPPQPASGFLPSGPIVRPPSDTYLQPVYNPKTPFEYRLRGCLIPGMLVYISGRPHVDPDRFSINFFCSGGREIAFHFNPRFREKTIVRNSYINNAWATEERSAPNFPFSPGVHFDMIVRTLEDKFQVAVNGQHFIEYRHRLQPLSRIDSFSIDGDIVISSVRFN